MAGRRGDLNPGWQTEYRLCAMLDFFFAFCACLTIAYLLQM